MYENVAKMMLEQYKDNIVVDEDLKDYLNSFSKDELIGKLGICCSCNSYDNLGEILLLQMKKKEEVVSYIINNINDLYVGLFQYMDKHFFENFKELIDNNGYMNINLDEFRCSISFIMFIRRVLIAKVNYKSKSNEIEIYMSKEILSAVKKLVDNGGIVKKNVKNSKVIFNIECMIDTYGIMDFDSLYNIYNDVFGKIDKKALFAIISNYSLFSEGINIFSGDDLNLICGVNFDNEDDAFSYYYSTEGEYKIFTRDEYYAIWDKSYINKMEEFFDLANYLFDTFDIYEDGIESFKELVLADYLYSCMEDDSVSKRNLMSKLDDIFEGITVNEKAKIGRFCERVYLNYPNWGIKGYSIKEKENDVKNK